MNFNFLYLKQLFKHLIFIVYLELSTSVPQMLKQMHSSGWPWSFALDIKLSYKRLGLLYLIVMSNCVFLSDMKFKNLKVHFYSIFGTGATVEPFGSFVSNLFTRWGDLDISIELSNGSHISSAGKKQKQTLLGDLLKALKIKGKFLLLEASVTWKLV